MEHVLDNPAYNALISGNKNLSNGTEAARYFAKDVAPFVGLKEANQKNFECLFDIIPFEGSFAFISPGEFSIKSPWKVVTHMQVLQMIFNKKDAFTIDDADIVPLGKKNIPDMLALTRLTNPGPFLLNTIAFGNYEGIFNGNQLVAMSGHRMHPFNYTEISAVCTHPDYLGKGYARKLIKNQIQKILSNSEIPFLHVKSENERAIKVYEDLGFDTRREMSIYIIQKEKNINKHA